MTNFEYILSHTSQRELAELFTRTGFLSNYNTKPYRAFTKWANSFTDNHGNMAYNHKTGELYEGCNRPSIWSCERFAYPNGEWKTEGRKLVVSFQVWLDKQYNPAEWSDEEE